KKVTGTDVDDVWGGARYLEQVVVNDVIVMNGDANFVVPSRIRKEKDSYWSDHMSNFKAIVELTSENAENLADNYDVLIQVFKDFAYKDLVMMMSLIKSYLVDNNLTIEFKSCYFEQHSMSLFIKDPILSDWNSLVYFSRKEYNDGDLSSASKEQDKFKEHAANIAIIFKNEGSADNEPEQNLPYVNGGVVVTSKKDALTIFGESEKEKLSKLYSDELVDVLAEIAFRFMAIDLEKKQSSDSNPNPFDQMFVDMFGSFDEVSPEDEDEPEAEPEAESEDENGNEIANLALGSLSEGKQTIKQNSNPFGTDTTQKRQDIIDDGRYAENQGKQCFNIFVGGYLSNELFNKFGKNTSFVALNNEGESHVLNVVGSYLPIKQSSRKPYSYISSVSRFFEILSKDPPQKKFPLTRMVVVVLTANQFTEVSNEIRRQISGKGIESEDDLSRVFLYLVRGLDESKELNSYLPDSGFSLRQIGVSQTHAIIPKAKGARQNYKEFVLFPSPAPLQGAGSEEGEWIERMFGDSAGSGSELDPD